MQPSDVRRGRSNNGVVAGSIWETRMKMDEVQGGIKIFSGDAVDNDDDDDESSLDTEGIKPYGKSRRKRRNWKPPEASVSKNGVFEKNPIQLKMDVVDDDETESFDVKEIDISVEKRTSFEKNEKILDAIDLNKIEPHPIEVEEDSHRMQSIVDLVMWRDISKSALVFGFGTFILLSSSYTKDLNFSLISAISYLGLVYLALIFIYKFILRRGVLEFGARDERCMIREEDAIRVLRLLLPCVNEVLTNVKSLLSGDPATTMKLAVVLFVMARCGSSITVWTLAKLVFFGVFTVPKFLSCCPVQLATYGKFWMEKLRYGWESFSQKKAFAAVIFIIIWNTSSAVVRIWAVFMLVVAMNLYQQHEKALDSKEEEDIAERQEDSKPKLRASTTTNNNRLQLHHRRRSGPKVIEKVKKGI